MGIVDIFSKRQKKLRGEVSEVYSYNQIPQPLRVQICHILRDVLGGSLDSNKSHEAYKTIVDALCREYGLFLLPPTTTRREYDTELCNFILNEKDPERVLDAVEISFRVVDGATRDYYFMNRTGGDERADAAIEELNGRFREHAVGFEFSNSMILRIDSEFVHNEVVKPALALLSGEKFAGAQEEFLGAHSHYRAGETKECLNDCLKAFESTMKAICDSRGWKYKAHASAKDIIKVCLDNDLIPTFWQQHFTSLRQELESSVPTGRNNLGGHGQGLIPVKVPTYLGGYMLHMTAASIVFLAKADAALK